MAGLDFPKRVFLQEEGPREGFQMEGPIAVSRKLELIHALAETGLHHINCASFVDARRVPQMADAQEVAKGLIRKPGVKFTGIWLNLRGFERALASGLDLTPNVVATVSNAFSLRNNGCSSHDLIERQRAMLGQYREHGLRLQAAHVFTAFGCNIEGPVSIAQCTACLRELLSVCREEAAWPPVVYLCDTVGAANPAQVRALLEAVRHEWPDIEFALHLHDTRGMGLANALAALQMGVARFDASIGGLGGCPFAGHVGASGNICTEDLAFMCEEMGIATGLNLDALLRCAWLAQDIVGHALPGRMMKTVRPV